jgi:arabinan endo-1,5-alpha-L-arabinosidase
LGSVVAANAAEPTELPSCPDPVIIASKEPVGYYVFSTGRGIPIWFSRDLREWKPLGRVFESGMPAWASEAIPRSRWIWAPDISYFGGKYHLYYAVSTFGSQRSVIGLAVNETLDAQQPNYRWEDRGLVIESTPGACDFNAIDPALFVDRDDVPYLVWGSYWTGLKGTRIDPATGKPAQNPPEIVPLAARAPGTDPPAIEAPFLVFRDGYYYLFVSWDFCCAGLESTYKILVGRSRSVLGPYVDDQGRALVDGYAKLVLAGSDRWRGPGHNSLLQTDQGDWLVYSCYDAQRQRRRGDRVLNIRPITWVEGWPVAGEPLELRTADSGERR